MNASKEMFYKLLGEDREDDRWDFKRDIHTKPKEKFYQLLKDILAFSNSGGGYLLLGIDDKEHKIVGVEQEIDAANLGQQIHTTLGVRVKFELNYFEGNFKEDKVKVGIMYIHEGERILTAPKALTSDSSTIIQADTVYVRRNTSSINANRDDLESLAYKLGKKGFYEYSEKDKEIIERNKEFQDKYSRIHEYLKDKFQFTAINFSYKLNELHNFQIKYNKLEIAMLLGFEEDKVDEYFNGYRLPKLEHILRANEIFSLPSDYFFHHTFYERKPLVHNPMI
ncbi:MAG: ATP-binding protein [Caryophanon sp.]|nr:ATP-binding protein [Caryophanon sp.]